MRASSYLLIIIIIVSLVFGGVSLTYGSLKMKLLPTIVSSLIFVLAVVELTREILAHRRVARKNQPKAETASGVDTIGVVPVLVGNKILDAQKQKVEG